LKEHYGMESLTMGEILEELEVGRGK
jgi:hypothetical protein